MEETYCRELSASSRVRERARILQSVLVRTRLLTINGETLVAKFVANKALPHFTEVYTRATVTGLPTVNTIKLGRTKPNKTEIILLTFL